MDLQSLENKIGYRFQNGELLKTALTHSSYTNENRGEGSVSYERLEFLGDAILGFVTAEWLYAGTKNPEGELTRMRAALVCESSLAAAAGAIGLGEYIRLGKGEAGGGGRTRPSILADVMEAVIAAIYLDGGMEEASGFVRRQILSEDSVERAARGGDYKTILQETVQREKDAELVYRLLEERGPDHQKVFVVEVLINGSPAGRGEGRNKKEAEQAAARAALEALGA